jgi:hypothetical protein
VIAASGRAIADSSQAAPRKQETRGDCLLDVPKACPGASGWTSEFLVRFGEPKGKNVYGDSAYFASVVDDAGRSELIRRVRELYRRGGELARRHIVYGSDWVMVAMEPGSDLYFRDFEIVMQQLEGEFPDVTRQFFVENAARYLGLGPNGATRRRIAAFLNPHGVTPLSLESPALPMQSG